MSNLIKKGLSSSKKNIRYIQNITQIHQFEENGQNTNKFEVVYRALKSGEEDILDRKVSYECENAETACYIVAKIKTQM